ncbi:hypothetical protein ACVBEG_27245 [Pseudomonas sp. GG8]
MANPTCAERTDFQEYVNSMQQMLNLFNRVTPWLSREHLQAYAEACQDIGLERPSCWSRDLPECARDGLSGFLSCHERTGCSDSSANQQQEVQAQGG